MKSNLQPHVQLDNTLTAKYAILPGDPQRVERVKEFLTEPIDLCFNREYKSCVGFYKGVEVLVMSTGMGAPSTAIGVEELYNLGVTTMIRIGSSGALQPELKLGHLVLASGAVRDDGTSKSYVRDSYPAIADPELLMTLKQVGNQLGLTTHMGITRSHDSLYTDDNPEIYQYWHSKNVLASDMETSILLVLGSLKKIRCGAILNVVVEEDGKLDEINDYVTGESVTAQGEKDEILLALESIVSLDQK